MGEYLHTAEDEMVCNSTNEKVPYFNAPIYLENKTQIGKVEEVFGPITKVVSVRSLGSKFATWQHTPPMPPTAA